ncbi:MAG TPA: tRNA pseudouridine(38-40) synthase TruA [Woeseiaceae bacterium]|nr:tRNA pseudouridine(38-40) synthase TruA [Woeseiaceae bacterium]
MRIALGIEYDGTAYNGWQRQDSGIGVQERVEEALSAVADAPVEATCAGRTDAGVHASAQVVHFDTRAERSPRNWVLGANSHLPPDVNALWAVPVPDDFHARYSARARTYRYLILNRMTRSALWRDRAWWVHRALDVEPMRAAAACLIGEHDFSAFRAAGCQAKTPRREVRAIEIVRRGDWVTIEATANAFLQHMVRNIVGVLAAVGTGERPPEWAAAVLESRDRREGGITAPAHGLTLVAVEYPPHFGLPPVRPSAPDAPIP